MCYARKFSLFLMKNILFTNIKYDKADISTLLSKGPPAVNAMYKYCTLLSKGPPTAIEMSKYFPFNLR